MKCQREPNLRDNRGWDESMELNIFVELLNRSEREKTWFLLILIQVLSYVVAGFYNCKLPLNVVLYISIFVFRARAWLSKRSILSAEEGKSFMLKTYFIKVSATPFLPASFLYETRRQNHDLIQFGDTIILQVYIKNRNWCLKTGKRNRFNFLLIRTKSIC